ncbi:hypothetical protein [Sphingomonas sp. LR55]|uniref:hypothetical protein n=1 Tax=Sphingomonas sp. LR55 TaxID=3050231 RepID=UPI002FDFD15B
MTEQPLNIVARRLLGAALLRSGDPRGALDVLRPIGLRRDADSYTLMLIARACEATGDRAMAAQFLDRAATGPAAPAAAFATDDLAWRIDGRGRYRDRRPDLCSWRDPRPTC